MTADLLTPPAFLVCGSPRTGTTYLADVLNKCGLNVGHEAWWRILAIYPERDLVGDVSCLGTFDEAYKGRVLAQVRNPRHAIPSIYRDLVGYGWHSTVNFYHSVTPECTGEPALDAARIWSSFTRRAVERAERWWRVEDITPQLLAQVFGVDEGDARSVLERASKTMNHRSEFSASYDWPDHPAIEAALNVGRRLGYRD